MSAIALLIPGQITAGSATGEAKPAGGVPGAQAQGMGALFQLLLNGNGGAVEATLPVVTDTVAAPVPMTLPAGLLPNTVQVDGAAAPPIVLPEVPAETPALPANLLAFAAPPVQTSVPQTMPAAPVPMPAEMPVPTPVAVAIPAAQTASPRPVTVPVPTVVSDPAVAPTPEVPVAVALPSPAPKAAKPTAPDTNDGVVTGEATPSDSAAAEPQATNIASVIVPMPVLLVPVEATAPAQIQATIQPLTSRGASPQAVTTVSDDAADEPAVDVGAGKPVNSAFADALGKASQPQRLEMPGAMNQSATTGQAGNSASAPAAPATGSGEVQQEAKAAPQPAAERPVDVAAANATHALSHPTVEKVQAAQHTANDNATTVRDTPASQVSVQLAHAVRTGESRIDVALTPAELGRVEIRLEIARDGSASAQIVAERADTLDLLKRDASTLERVLQDSGLRADSSSLSFNLRGEGQRNQNQQNTPSSPAPYAQPLVADEDQPVIQRRYAWQSDSGLDISV